MAFALAGNTRPCPSPSGVLYLAYGSNMLTARLQARVPSAQPVGVARLPRHVLCFHKRSHNDGSGKCTLQPASEAVAAVFGVLFEIEPSERPALDRAEGLGVGYAARTVTVHTACGPRRAYTYQARPDHLDATLRPYVWYRALVIAGAREHGLPASHRARLRAVPAQRDPDADRRQRHRTLLPASAATANYQR